MNKNNPGKLELRVRQELMEAVRDLTDHEWIDLLIISSKYRNDEIGYYRAVESYLYKRQQR